MIRSFAILLSCCIISFVLGSVHAYSVFLESLESQFAVSRDLTSIGYSIALASLTFAVLVGHHFYARLRPALFAVLLIAIAVTGVVMAAFSRSIWQFWMGYGLIFGFANGLGYGYCLQLSSRIWLTQSGTSMGIVTAFYALGATVFPTLFSSILAQGTVWDAMMVLTVALILCGTVSSVALFMTKSEFLSDSVQQSNEEHGRRQVSKAVLWLGYGTGAGAGLMIIGHAHAILTSLGLTSAIALLGTTLFAAGNMVGGLTAGVLCDRTEVRKLLIVLPILSSAMIIALQFALPLSVTMVAMALLGYCYGAVIVCYPSAVTEVYGVTSAPQVYGKIFTAWGLAGLTGPWIAGILYESSTNYELPLYCAAGLGLVSAATIVIGFKPNSQTIPG